MLIFYQEWKLLKEFEVRDIELQTNLTTARLECDKLESKVR